MREKFILSIDLGGNGTKLAIMDNTGSIVKKGRFATEAQLGVDRFFNKLKSKIDNMLKKALITKDDLAAIGMGSPGPLDIKKGIMHHSANFPGWKNVNFKEFFSKAYGLPSYFDNDVNLVAFGEYYRKLRSHYSYVIVLTLGTGLGGAYIEDGKLLHGRDGFAGEFGHIEIMNEGIDCGCGSAGCLEAYVSASGIKKRLELLQADPVKKKEFLSKLKEFTPKEVYKEAVAGNPHAIEFFEQTGHYLGMGLTTITNIFNPEAIFIGGGMYLALKYILPTAREYLRTNGFPEMVKGLRLRRIDLSENSALYGGYLLAKENL
ncbi:ROK family protein [bacterium]|nr:ROK family protein [bacterium]